MCYEFVENQCNRFEAIYYKEDRRTVETPIVFLSQSEWYNEARLVCLSNEQSVI